MKTGMSIRQEWSFFFQKSLQLSICRDDLDLYFRLSATLCLLKNTLIPIACISEVELLEQKNESRESD